MSELIKVTKEECDEVDNCYACHKKEDGTYECAGCGSVYDNWLKNKQKSEE